MTTKSPAEQMDVREARDPAWVAEMLEVSDIQQFGERAWRYKDAIFAALRQPAVSAGETVAENDHHYLSCIRDRLDQLYRLVDDPRSREHISDEVDWVEARLAALPPSNPQWAKQIVGEPDWKQDQAETSRLKPKSSAEQMDVWEALKELRDAVDFRMNGFSDRASSIFNGQLIALELAEVGNKLDAILAALPPSNPPGDVREKVIEGIIERECYVAACGDGYYVSGVEQAATAIRRALASPKDAAATSK